jgi:hypothetical protein
MTADAVRWFVLAHAITTNERQMNSAISLPLAHVASVPPKPTRKSKKALPLDSREWRKLYAEIMAMMGQIRGAEVTVPPVRRTPATVVTVMTLCGWMGISKTTKARRNKVTCLS